VSNILVLVKFLVKNNLSECAGAVNVVEGVVGFSVYNHMFFVVFIDLKILGVTVYFAQIFIIFFILVNIFLRAEIHLIELRLGIYKYIGM
jgi:hypothetical protein